MRAQGITTAMTDFVKAFSTSDEGERATARQALEEAIEDELDRSYKLGISSGLGEAATHLKREAGDNFAEGADKEAHWARGKAKFFEACAKKAHPGER